MVFARGLTGWNRALLLGVLVSIAYASVVITYSALAPEISVTGSFLVALLTASIFSSLTIGVPIALWVSLRIRAPLVLMAFVLLFWHVFIYFPGVGSGAGDSPAFALVLFWAPLYLVAYGLFGGLEYWLRRRDMSVATLRA